MAQRPTPSRPPRDYDRDPARMQIPVEAGSIEIGLFMYWALRGKQVRAIMNGEKFDTSPESLSPTRAAEVMRDALTAELRTVIDRARAGYEQHAATDPAGAAELARTAAHLAYAVFGAPLRTGEAAPAAAAVGGAR